MPPKPAATVTDAIPAPATPPPAAKSEPPTVNVNVGAIDHDRILTAAGAAMVLEPVTITKFRARLSEGTPNDFYSTGDTWWPDPNSPDGLPYFQRPNHINPNNFNEHRKLVLQIRDNVAALAAAYKITGNNRYAATAAIWVRTFFVDPATRMNPNLRYAQSVPGVTSGRIYGVDDVLPLVEIPNAVKVLERSPAFPPDVSKAFKKWSADYVDWLTSSTNGDQMAEAGDEHSVVYWLHIAAFANYLDDDERLSMCRNRFKYFMLPNQLNSDGSFNRSSRVKTYSDLLSQTDNLVAICQILSTSDDNLWQFTTPNGRTIRQTVDYIYPYLEDRSKWPSKHKNDSLVPRESNQLFAALAYRDSKYLDLWKILNPDIENEEIRRSCAVTQPVLWVP
ncbi:MAG TPA: alginate lyase family protein [Desulfuromonadaceae bacterium]|nr:alginate lyase family protein [Desulfuromonadaceae bacterium]